MQPPPTSGGGTAPVYTNVWATFENVPNDGSDSLDYAPDESTAAPAPRYIIAEGEFFPGEVIKPPATPNAAAIDFADRPETTATATQDSSGVFSVIYG
ncbi:MAG: hypothetical protein J7515_01525 [Caulobacter sp.]|nr:hypothetical protein [Caulobacter sp.]